MAFWSRKQNVRFSKNLISDNRAPATGGGEFVKETLDPNELISRVEHGLHQEQAGGVADDALPMATGVTPTKLVRSSLAIKYLMARESDGGLTGPYAEIVEHLNVMDVSEERLSALTERIQVLQADMKAKGRSLDHLRFQDHMAEEGIEPGLPTGGSANPLKGELSDAAKVYETLEESEVAAKAKIMEAIDQLVKTLTHPGEATQAMVNELNARRAELTPKQTSYLMESSDDSSPDLESYFDLLREGHGELKRHSGDSAFTLHDETGD